MSSHHIVREKQEPALLITGIDTIHEELLGQLLEWSPTVLVTTATAEKVDAMGIKIDMQVGGEALQLQSDIKVVDSNDQGDTAAALQHLVSNGYPAVNVVTDEVDLKDYLFYTDKINIVIYSGNKRIYPIQSGFSKWKPAGEHITLITHATGFVQTGLEHRDGHKYVTTHDGFITMQFEQPFLYIAEDI